MSSLIDNVDLVLSKGNLHLGNISDHPQNLIHLLSFEVHVIHQYLSPQNASANSSLTSLEYASKSLERSLIVVSNPSITQENFELFLQLIA